MLTSVLDRRVMAERFGAAPGNVLALHGWARTHADFGAALTGLDALALDLPGFGATADPEAGWSTAEYAELLAPLLAELDRPVIVGHSFGGRVAAHLAAQSPTLIRGVVFTGAPLLRPAGSAPKPKLGYRAARALAKVAIIPEKRFEALREKRSSPDFRAAQGVMREVFVKCVNEDYSAQLALMAAAGVPVRFVCGEGDTAAPVAMSQHAAELVGAPAPVVVHGSAHLLDTALSSAIHAAIIELLAPVPGVSVGTALLWAASAAVTLVVDYKWLRVAQREHYAPGRVGDIWVLWARVWPPNAAAWAVGAVLTVVGFLDGGYAGFASLAALAIYLVFPLGLSLFARSKPLAWTPRLRRAGLILVLLDLALFAIALGINAESSVVAALLAPVAVDAALWLVAPVERRLSRKFVVSARARLRRVGPTVVAITGSYGKTSTKNYALQLIGGARTTYASPASFNNLMGLSRAVNEGLADGTEVFVAEMGTYGPGEIRKLCDTFPPDVSAITTIGEAHLERMKDRATIVRAKSEITERPPVVVLNVDVPELATLADALEMTKRVIRCSTTDGGADVSVIDDDGTWSLAVAGKPLTDVTAPPTGHPINLAVAAGLALAVDVPSSAIARALERGLPHAAHRAEVNRTADGVTIIDDTYNANPDGAAQALRAAREMAGSGRIFTITPGMVELGSRQAEANRELGRDATSTSTMTVCVTGRTNRKALLAGATGPGAVRIYPDRSAAAAAVLKEARAGDVIVYENDLPDHYP